MITLAATISTKPSGDAQFTGLSPSPLIIIAICAVIVAASLSLFLLRR